MKTVNFESLAQKCLLPYLRQNKDISTIVKIIAKRFAAIQDVITVLLNMLSIQNARDNWLDLIGKELNAKRDEIDFGDYFCTGKLHINSEQKFYFLSSKEDPRKPITLQDFEFVSKILAYVGANSSFGTIEEILSIIKRISNADKVYITKDLNGNLKINICGNRLILTRNTINYIKQNLGNGTKLKEITKNEQTT